MVGKINQVKELEINFFNLKFPPKSLVPVKYWKKKPHDEVKGSLNNDQPILGRFSTHFQRLKIVLDIFVQLSNVVTEKFKFLLLMAFSDGIKIE